MQHTLRVYQLKPNQPKELKFQTLPTSKCPYFDALEKFRRFLHLSHPMAILRDVANTADDPYLVGSPKMDAAIQLLQIVFKAAGYELIEVL